MAFLRKMKSIHDVRTNLSREEVLRRSRILIVDDERPDIVDDLKKARFSVDYEPDITKDNMNIIDHLTYDLVLLDFGNVGKAFGSDEGLSLLRHIKRVNPSVVVLAYTSKALSTSYADFYRLTDGVLAKDAGIAESLEKIEDGLRKAHSIENIWVALLTVTGIQSGSNEDKKLQDLLIRGFQNKRKLSTFKQNLFSLVGDENTKSVANILFTKMVELGIKALVAA